MSRYVPDPRHFDSPDDYYDALDRYSAPAEREEAEPRAWDDANDAALAGEIQDRSDRFHEAQLRKDT